ALAFAADGSSLAAVCSDQTLRLWDLAKDGERIRIDLKSPDKAPGMRARPNRGFAFVRFAAGRSVLVKDFVADHVRLVDASDGKELRAFAGHRGPMTAAALTPDGRTLATGGDDKEVVLWEVATGQERRRLTQPSEPRALAFAPDGNTLAV